MSRNDSVKLINRIADVKILEECTTIMCKIFIEIIISRDGWGARAGKGRGGEGGEGRGSRSGLPSIRKLCVLTPVAYTESSTRRVNAINKWSRWPQCVVWDFHSPTCFRQKPSMSVY